MKKWELSFGTYPGILLGFRSYWEENKVNHVLYIPFADVCLTIFNGQYKQQYTIGYNSSHEVCEIYSRVKQKRDLERTSHKKQSDAH